MMYLLTNLINFIVGAAEVLVLIVIILIIRYYMHRGEHLSQAQVNDKVKEVAVKGMTTCTTPVHAMDVVNACPVMTRIQRVNDTLYNVREVKE